MEVQLLLVEGQRSVIERQSDRLYDSISDELI